MSSRLLNCLAPRLGLSLLVALLLAGCASYHAGIDPRRTLASTQRFFVVSNLNDSHALDRQIAASLQARGRTAEIGPLTMMPDDTQAVITFGDHWTWDFRDHLISLLIEVRDPGQNQAYARATFSAKVPGREPSADIVDRLVEQLLAR